MYGHRKPVKVDIFSTFPTSPRDQKDQKDPKAKSPTTKAAHRYGVFRSFETDVVTETHGFAIESHSWA